MNGVYYVPAFQVHEFIDIYQNQPVRLTVQVAWIFFPAFAGEKYRDEYSSFYLP